MANEALFIANPQFYLIINTKIIPLASIHYFNPGHETAVLLGKKNYTAPSNVRIMTEDLSILPMWYAKENDFVLTEHILSAVFHQNCEQLFNRILATPVSREDINKVMHGEYVIQASPWGISPHALNLFSSLNNSCISVSEWKDTYKILTGRQTSRCCLDLLSEMFPDIKLPSKPQFYNNIKLLSDYIEAHYGETLILKSPFSSSGRGLLWIQYPLRWGKKELMWAKSVIDKQGEVSVEPALDKCLDFAMEFYSDGKGNISYEGLSVFSTEERGAYSGNIIGNEKILEKELLKYVSYNQIATTKEMLGNALRKIFSKEYRGFLGVDMLVYNENGSCYIHPCVEINMRYTMGMVALQLSRNFIDNATTGKFIVTFEKENGAALKKHEEMKRNFPLIFKNGKIETGYFSLCPVMENTHYRAYVLCK